jgi:hypothetical protein
VAGLPSEFSSPRSEGQDSLTMETPRRRWSSLTLDQAEELREMSSETGRRRSSSVGDHAEGAWEMSPQTGRRRSSSVIEAHPGRA